MTETLARRCAAGEIRAVARLISLLEDGDEEAFRILSAMPRPPGGAYVIGVTGPPGSGKSTLVDKLIGEFRTRGRKVGVLAVDPSSPFSGGAILGDRLRMQAHATDPGVFIRSLASRGKLGGLSAATAFCAKALQSAGFDIVLVETVGVGQSEVDVMKVADSVLLVSVPGLGDDIQVIKAGIMEIGDLFVVNKADRDGADRVVREIRAMLETQAALRRGRTVAAGPDTLASRSFELLHHGLQAGGSAPGLEEGPAEAAEAPLAPVLKTVAETGEGVGALVEALLARLEGSRITGELDERRRASVSYLLKDLVFRKLEAYFSEREDSGRLDRIAGSILAGDTDVHTAAEELFAEFLGGGK